MRGRFEKIKRRVLGEKYDLSLVFADNTLMKKLNATYRKKNSPTNVLSFPLSAEQGEIFLSKNIKNPGEKEYLFVHSLLHLKGYRHGKRMESEEEKIMAIVQ